MKTFFFTAIFLFSVCPIYAEIDYVHIIGPNYSCPGTEHQYHLETDLNGRFEWTITNGKIWDPVEEEYKVFISYIPNVGGYPSRGATFNILFDEDGSTAHIHVKVTAVLFSFNADKNIAFDPPSGTPGFITGSSTIANCINQTKDYSPVNLAQGWLFDYYTWSSGLEKDHEDGNTITIKGKYSDTRGWESLVGHFKYHEIDQYGTHYCGTRTNTAEIWLGQPGISNAEILPGIPYPGSFPCVIPNQRHYIQIANVELAILIYSLC